MAKIRLTESQLHNVIKESVKKVIANINEATRVDYVARVQDLVNQANQAIASNSQEYGSGALMGKDGDTYDVKGLKLTGNGYLVFTIHSWQDETEKIRMFTRKGGALVPYKDEIGYDYDYKDGLKFLKKFIADAERALKDIQGYDPNWEEQGDEGKKAIRGFNKSIGVKAGARMPQ